MSTPRDYHRLTPADVLGPADLVTLADHVALWLGHARASAELARQHDRVIVLLLGCPVETLDRTVTVAELQAAGLQLPEPEDEEW